MSGWPRFLRWAAVLVVALSALALLSQVYVFVGYRWIENSCVAGFSRYSNLGFEVSWWPPEFACDFDDGARVDRSRLFWSVGLS